MKVSCTGCNVTLNLKEEFAGRRFKCPRCGTILTAPMSDAASPAGSPAAGSAAASASPALPPNLTGSVPGNASQAPQKDVQNSNVEAKSASNPASNSASNSDFKPDSSAIAKIPRLEKLNPEAVYLLLSPEKVIGLWKLTTGWQVKGNHGLVPAKSNPQDIPATGKFTLVELLCQKTEQGKKLHKMSIFQLSGMNAAKRIAGEPYFILSAISGYATLVKAQKNEVLAALKDCFMREVWGQAEKIREFLIGFDVHSSVIEDN